MLNKDYFLTRKPAQITEVTLPDGTVFIKKLTAYEKDSWATLLNDPIQKKNIRATLVVRALCDEQGTRVFKNSDAKQLGETLDSETMDLLFNAIVKDNTVTEEEAKEATDLFE